MEYIVNGVKYDYDSPKNQNIIRKLVDREVYCCMTSEVEYMLPRAEQEDDDNPFTREDYEESFHFRVKCDKCGALDSYDEIEFSELKNDDFPITEDGTYECPMCGREYTELADARECCSYEDEVFKCSDCGSILSKSDYNLLDSEPATVFEWWAVTKGFGEMLKEQGCVVIDAWGKSYWGRETSGQSIALDGCIIQIAANMRILEGMEYEWKL